MAILDTLKGWWHSLTTTTANIASMPIIGTGGMIDSTSPELKAILHISEAESKKQRAILRARKFHEGLQDTKLTERLRVLLGDDADDAEICLNFVAKVNTSLAQRMVIEGWDNNAADKDNQIAFANQVWAGSRMKGKRAAVLLNTVRDGESFIAIDEDKENSRQRWTPHQRYTDPTLGGDGEGCLLFYPNDDADQKPLMGVKRWAEQIRQPNGTTKPVDRITVWTDRKIMRYAKTSVGWQNAALALPGGGVLPAVEWNTVDGTETGEPLGIPLVHLKTPELMPAAHKAIGIQKGLNKTYVDMLTASDMEAMRLLIALGWKPQGETTDETDDDAPIKIEAGTWMWTTEPDASVHEVTAADSTRFISLIDKHIALMADITNTPLSLLQRSAQRAAEGTLQEEKEDFFAKVRDTRETLEIGFEDALKISRRRHNVFFAGEDGALPELAETGADFIVRWQELSPRTIDDKSKEADALKAAGVPDEIIWSDVFNFDPDKIERIKQTPAYKMMQAGVMNALSTTLDAKSAAEQAGLPAPVQE